MIFVRSGTLSAVLALAVGSVLSVSVWAYRIGIACGRKGDAELLLFIGILSCVALLALGFLSLMQAGRKKKELETYAALVRNGGDAPIDRLLRFGPLGKSLRSLVADTTAASERKSARIASLSGLVRALLDADGRPLLVATLDGRISDCSRSLREDPRFEDLVLGATRVDDLFPGVESRSVLFEADRTHSAVSRDGPVVFHPVYSTRGEIGHFLVDASRNAFSEMLALAKKNGASNKTATEEGARRRPAALLGLVGDWARRIRRKQS